MIDAGRRLLKTFLVPLVLASAFATPAHAGGCGQAVIDDWADNGQVDGSYAPDCYGDAIDNLPEDLAAYSSAADDIARSRQDALLAASGSSSSGDGGSSSETSGSGGSQDAPEPSDTGSATGPADDQDAAARVGESGSLEVPASRPVEDGAAVAVASAVPKASAFDASLGNPSGGSLPLPIIILAAALGIAIIGIAARLLVTRRARE